MKIRILRDFQFFWQILVDGIARSSYGFKKVLDVVDKNDFPFLATIKSFRIGRGVVYKFI